MSYHKDQWIAEYERIGDDYPDEITREEAENRMKTLGFDPREIKDQLDMLEEEYALDKIGG